MKLCGLVLLLVWTIESYGASIRSRAPPVPFTNKINLPHKDLINDARVLHMDDFVPLSCNANLDSANCVPWSSYVQSTSERVIIECGDCVEMDFAGPTLTLDDGIDIQGKLKFPDIDAQLTIETPLVAVQGELEMTATKAVDGTANVKFRMVGETDQYFTPVDSNSMACGMGQPCQAGKKAITVAGGKLNIHGLPEDTPTWLNLYDVASVSGSSSISSEDYETYVPPPVDCPSDGILIQEDFTAIELGTSFGATLGSNFEFTGNSLNVYNRTAAFQGPQVDLNDVRRCLAPERVYLLTARVRLTKEGVENGTPTTCASSGEDCLIIRYEYMREDEGRSAPYEWSELQSFQHQYGVTFTIAQEVTFSESEVRSSHIYESFRFYGPGAGVDIELEEFNLRLPPPEAYTDASSVCQHLVPGNGDAEVSGLSPFPFYKNAYYSNLVVAEDTGSAGNHYFEITGRKYAYFTNSNDPDWDMAGLTWDIPSVCVKKESLINFQADIRVHPNDEHAGPFVVKVYMRADRDGVPDSNEIIATCPPSDGIGWVRCVGAFTVPPDFVEGSIKKFDVRFRTDQTGINYDLDNLVLDVDSPPNAIIVDSAVKDKWAPGAEIIITSHTRDWDAHQLRRIEQVSEQDDNHVLIKLDSSFRRPTTLLDSPHFAVEVALLSRNIVFEGGDDGNPDHGGHFWIMHTPLVEQHIEGVEVKNFGQQGTLGRYPIHFHFCGDVGGSVLKKNTIRQSKQRCVVVHGTNNLMVSQNVAYDTKGHCFILEDGMETGNYFIRNLGAQTGRVTSVIPNMPDKANGDETDDKPATFWITNPSNTWIENVAAGSISSGFWFELQLRVNEDKSLRTYPSAGYDPDEQAVFEGFKSYRNDNSGIFFHNSRNLAVIGGLFADNKIGIDIDRAEEVEVKDTTIIGESDLYKQLMGTQDEEDVCNSNSQVTGIEVHTFARNAQDNGARISNVEFSNFASTACDESFAFRLDDDIRLGTFDWFTTLSQITIEPDSAIINFCPAKDVGIVDAYFTDLDGSLKPPTSSTSGPATLVSNNDDMLAFVDVDSDCHEVNDHCYTYCDSTCFRSVRYAVDPTGTENVKLKVCQQANSSSCIYLSSFFYEEDDQLDNTKSSKYRIFVAHLPTGTYDAVFVDEGGSEVWPSFVEEAYEDSLCPTAFEDGAVTLKQPTLESQGLHCNELIRNGDAEASPNSPTFWLHRSGGVQVVEGAGIDGSIALADVERDGSDDAVAQFLDTRCMLEGRIYEITAWVKLEKPDGSPYTCDPNSEKCAEVGIRVPGWSREPIAETTPEFSPGEFQLVHGLFQINDKVAAADKVEFYVERNRDDLNMYVDNVSMKLLPMYTSSDDECSDNLVYNGDFTTGDGRFWDRHNSEDILIDVGSAGSPDYALSMKDGYSRPFLRIGCMTEGERYEVSISYKLRDENGNAFACDIVSPNSSTRCPKASLVSTEKDVWLESKDVAWNIGTPSSTEWNQLYGVFTATTKNIQADSLRLYFSDLINDFTLLVDNVEVKHVPQDCSNLILHSDMELGYGGLWYRSGNGVLSNVQGYNSSTAIRFGGRLKNWNGPRYEDNRFMDYRCLTDGSEWEVSAQIKVIDPATGQGAVCDLESSSSSVSCPQVRIEIKNGSNLVFKERIKGYEGAWNVNEFNHFKAGFTLTPTLADWDGTVTDISLSIRDFPSHLDVVVDDFALSPVEA